MAVWFFGRRPLRILLSFAASILFVAAFGTISPAVAAQVTPVSIGDTHPERSIVPTTKLWVGIDSISKPVAAPMPEPGGTDLPPVVPAAEQAPVTPSARPPVIVAPHLNDAARGGLRKRTVLLPMFISLASLQFYDAYSTVTALNRGMAEGNPVMLGVTRNTGAFAGVKVATSVTMIYAANRLWNHHHRAAAIAVMGISNVVAALVATNNAAALEGRR
jgi:hypothetical protein